MIAAKLTEARQKKGYSLGDLANKAGVTRQMIYRYEKGSKPIRKNLLKIAKALDLPIEHFLLDEIDGKIQIVSTLWRDLESKMPQVKKFSNQELKVLLGLIDQIIEKREQIFKNYS